jgi:hypothetical protein
MWVQQVLPVLKVVKDLKVMWVHKDLKVIMELKER